MTVALFQRLSATAIFVALAALIAGGGGVRYFCVCAGSPVLTLHEHCHGEHGEAGPIHHAPPGHRHDDDHDHGLTRDSGDDHRHHHHELVKSDDELRIPTVASAPELKLLSLCWTAPRAGEAIRPPRAIDEGRSVWIAEAPPPPCRQLARSVVRLI